MYLGYGKVAKETFGLRVQRKQYQSHSEYREVDYTAVQSVTVVLTGSKT